MAIFFVSSFGTQRCWCMFSLADRFTDQIYRVATFEGKISLLELLTDAIWTDVVTNPPGAIEHQVLILKSS